MNNSINIGSYEVSVKFLGIRQQIGIVTQALAEDMPTDWTFPWTDLWRTCNSEKMNIVKLSTGKELWGLVRFAIHPNLDKPSLVLIDTLEANPVSRGSNADRLLEPIGKWLLWYCADLALQRCSGDEEKLLYLFSKAKTFVYYKDKARMEYVNTVELGPGEKVHAFKFSRQSATAFSRNLENLWGTPRPINP
ncbi:hypothetical protein Cylst_4902 [Cylindrospermum stagnale PCC 7417]|uniref:Uncharacterized protein n=1 Tax=Cylindrospermum stagnale PCC 7417 TaxID=56107 RepID=K9X4C7_9NOST|nr:hypothetical protein [Cylindrospermum stagnale]AFZ26954.1 hypothetical protein Cylst_4902 [Cylindrospermum stagnale PCC 7417]